jgi:hypothetical protein
VSDSAAVNLAFRWLLSQLASPITPEFLPSATAMVARMVKFPAVLF